MASSPRTDRALRYVYIQGGVQQCTCISKPFLVLSVRGLEATELTRQYQYRSPFRDVLYHVPMYIWCNHRWPNLPGLPPSIFANCKWSWRGGGRPGTRLPQMYVVWHKRSDYITSIYSWPKNNTLWIFITVWIISGNIPKPHRHCTAQPQEDTPTHDINTPIPRPSHLSVCRLQY